MAYKRRSSLKKEKLNEIVTCTSGIFSSFMAIASKVLEIKAKYFCCQFDGELRKICHTWHGNISPHLHALIQFLLFMIWKETSWKKSFLQLGWPIRYPLSNNRIQQKQFNNAAKSILLGRQQKWSLVDSVEINPRFEQSHLIMISIPLQHSLQKRRNLLRILGEHRRKRG